MARPAAYIDDELQVGDIVDGKRGTRQLHTGGRGTAPVVLLSAGIGVTPVLAMLHALAAEASPREVWWLHGTRNGREHPFAEETRGLLAGACLTATATFATARPILSDRPNVDFDASGHLDMRLLQGLGLPRDGDFYICGPSSFMSDLTEGLAALGVAAGSHSHRDVRRRSVHYPGRRGFAAPAAAFAGQAAWHRRAGFVRAERPQRPLGGDVPKLARAGRGVRRAGAMVVPNRGLPHLRDRAGGGNGRLPVRTRSMHRRTAMC